MCSTQHKAVWDARIWSFGLAIICFAFRSFYLIFLVLFAQRLYYIEGDQRWNFPLSKSLWFWSTSDFRFSAEGTQPVITSILPCSQSAQKGCLRKAMNNAQVSFYPSCSMVRLRDGKPLKEAMQIETGKDFRWLSRSSSVVENDCMWTMKHGKL